MVRKEQYQQQYSYNPNSFVKEFLPQPELLNSKRAASSFLDIDVDEEIADLPRPNETNAQLANEGLVDKEYKRMFGTNNLKDSIRLAVSSAKSPITDQPSKQEIKNSLIIENDRQNIMRSLSKYDEQELDNIMGVLNDI